MDATDSSPRRTSSIIRRFSSIERSRLPPRVSVCFASSSVDVSISSPKWTRTPCPSLRTHHRRMRCQGSDGGDRTLTVYEVVDALLRRRARVVEVALEAAGDADRLVCEPAPKGFLNLCEVGMGAYLPQVLLQVLEDFGRVAHG